MARREADFYPTPRWPVRRLLERVPLPGGRWWEPCAGEGAIIRAVERDDIRWTATELREEARSRLDETGAAVVIANVFAVLRGEPLVDTDSFDVIISNPPFSCTDEIIRRLLPRVRCPVVMLLPLDWQCSEDREWLVGHEPDIWALPERPSFDGEGTDMKCVGWYIWPQGGAYRNEGRRGRLALTPLAQRDKGTLPAWASSQLDLGYIAQDLPAVRAGRLGT